MSVTQGLTGRALGEAVIDQVLSHPERHDQSATVSACGSTACLAGWTVLIHHGAQNVTRLDLAFFEVSKGASFVEASELLGVDEDAFYDAVYEEPDRGQAITNLKHLLNTSERAA